MPLRPPLGMGDVNWGVEIRWHGHSCFSLKDSLNRVLVIDPFDETVGSGHLRLKGDAILITHNHFDHNAVRLVKARLRSLDLVQSTGTLSVASDIYVTGIDSDHDDQGGQIHGPNRIYTFIMGGLRVVHLGDLGQKELTNIQKAMIGKVDVLLLPIGGFTTLNPKTAKKIAERLKPAVILPMHYGDSRFYKLASIEKFTELFDKSQVIHSQKPFIRVRKADLTDFPKVYILKPAPVN